MISIPVQGLGVKTVKTAKLLNDVYWTVPENGQPVRPLEFTQGPAKFQPSGSQLGGVLHLRCPETFWVVTAGERVAAGVEWVEAGDAPKPSYTGWPRKNYLDKMSTAKVEQPYQAKNKMWLRSRVRQQSWGTPAEV